MKIIADKNIPFLKGVVEQYGSTEYLEGADFTHQNIKDADALIVRTVARFDEKNLRDTSIKLICSATIGYDHIDTDYCDAHNIEWRNAPGCNSSSVQQYVVSSLIILSMKYNFCLKDMTIGIVGVGNVGRKVAKACHILGMKVLLNDLPRQKVEGDAEFVSLERIKQEADIITFHTPLTMEGEYRTLHLVDERFFASLTKKPFIINSARGGIVKTDAMKTAIAEQKIKGAVIDCWEGEPQIDTEYMDMVDIATPHIAGYSADGKANATRMSLASIADFFNLDKSVISGIEAPQPPQPAIDLNDEVAENRIFSAILRTYNPMEDDAKLRENPASFKRLRNEYPLRREYPAYNIGNATEKEASILNDLGFTLKA